MYEFKIECHCMKIQCSFALPATTVVQCHCQNCRKMQGSDYSTWLAIIREQFSIDAGRQFITEYQINERSSKSFCSFCGTVVCAINGKHFNEHLMVPLGVVKNYSPDLEPRLQVYVTNKAEWVQIHDGVNVLDK